MNEIEFTDFQTGENFTKGKGIMKTGDLIQIVYKVSIISHIAKTQVQ